MSKGHSQLIYDRFRESPALKPLDRFPKSVHDRLRSQFEGIVLPKSRSKRNRFLENIGPLAEHVLSDQKRRAISEMPAEFDESSDFQQFMAHSIERKFSGIRPVLELSLKSSNPSGYLKFLAPRGPNFIDHFEQIAGFFSTGRNTQISYVSDKAKENRERLRKIQEEGSFEELLSLLEYANSTLGWSEWIEHDLELYLLAGMLYSDMEHALRFAIEKDPIFETVMSSLGDTFESEIEDFKARGAYVQKVREMFHNLGVFPTPEGIRDFKGILQFGIFSGYIVDKDDSILMGRPGVVYPHESLLVVGSDSEGVIQHELQHIFDSMVVGDNDEDDEYRTKLAELLFVSDMTPQKWIEDRIYAIRMIAANNIRLERGEPPISPIPPEHEKAEKKLFIDLGLDILGSLLGNARPPTENLLERARQLFNDSYRRLCGLTYDEILEPFRKTS